jgi:hypothetical protein
MPLSGKMIGLVVLCMIRESLQYRRTLYQLGGFFTQGNGNDGNRHRCVNNHKGLYYFLEISFVIFDMIKRNKTLYQILYF